MYVFYLLLSIIIYILIYVIYRYLIRNQKYWEKQGVPNAYSSVPFFGNVWPVLLQRKSLGVLYHEIHESTSYSMIGLYNCGEHELLVRDPELVKTILQTNFNSFRENGISFDEELDSLLKRSPFVTSGEKWKNNRAVLTNAMSTSKLKNMTLTIREVGEKFSKYLQNQMKIHGGSFEIEAQTLFARFTAEIIARVGFGLDGQCFEKDTGTFADMGSKIFHPSALTSLKQSIAHLLPPLSKILKLGFFPKEFEIYCRRVVSDVLQMRNEKGLRGNDFIQHVYDLYKAEHGEIDEDFVTCHAISFYIDGYLTSSYTLSHVAYDIAKRPEVQNKLRGEIIETLKKHQGELTYEAIQDMKYMDLVIKESMRVFSVLSMIQKKCTEECELVGADGIKCVLKPGTKVIFSPNGLHNDPKYWSNPEVFQPERFDNETKHNFHKFAYLPFGGGPRVCVGMRMAMLQMKYAIATLINNYSITVSSKTKLPFTYECVAVLNIAQGGIWINIKPLH